MTTSVFDTSSNLTGEEVEKALDSLSISHPSYGKALSSFIRHCYPRHDFKNARKRVEEYLRHLEKSPDLSLQDVQLVQQSQMLFPVDSAFYSEVVVGLKRRFLAQIRRTPHDHHRTFSKKLESLIAMRLFREAGSLLQDRFNPQGAKVARHFRHLKEVQRSLGTHWLLADCASENELRPFASSHVLYRGRFCALQDLPEDVHVIQFFFHTNFFRPDAKARFGVFERHNDFARTLLTSLIDRQYIALLPRHQFNSFGVAASTAYPALSHHTIGGHKHHWHYKESAFPGYFMLDPGGFSGWSSLAAPSPTVVKTITQKSSREAMEFTKAMQASRVAENASKYTQPKQARLPKFKGRYVFLPMQVVNDQTGNLAYVDGVTLARTLIEHYAGSGTKVVIKRHPLCKDPQVARFLKEATRNHHVIVSEASIHDLIAGAQCVFVVNSGVGLEALLHGKPVVCTGASEYALAATTAKSVDELKSILESGVLADRTTSDRFIDYLFNDYFIEFGNKDKIRERVNDMIEKMEMSQGNKVSDTLTRNPIDFFCPGRLDLVVKYLFAQAFLNRRKDEIHYRNMRQLYATHILYRRRGSEDDKTSVQDYLKAFENLLTSMSKSGYNPAHPIPVVSGIDSICNGAHRIAAAAALGLPVTTLPEASSYAPSWGYTWFTDCHFPQQSLDLILRTYIGLKKKNLAIFCFWPASEAFWPNYRTELEEHGEIVVWRTLSLRSGEFAELIRDIYAFNTPGRTSPLIEEKVRMLQNLASHLAVAVVEFHPCVENPSQRARELKDRLRTMTARAVSPELYASVHASESEAELLHISNLVFSTTYLDHLKLRSPVQGVSQKFDQYLQELVHALEVRGIPLADACVVGSASLELFGLRAADDLDIIIREEWRNERFQGTQTSFPISENVDVVRRGFHRKNAQGVLYTDEDIIGNPDLHYHVRGIKFASLGVVRDRKIASHRDKDLYAVMLIDGLLNSCRGYPSGNINFNGQMLNVLSVSRTNPVISRMMKESKKYKSGKPRGKTSFTKRLVIACEKRLVKAFVGEKKYRKYCQSPDAFFADSRSRYMQKYGEFIHNPLPRTR